MTEPVFLHYDREALDREYFIRGRVPEWDDKVSQFQAWSESRRAEGRCDLDVSYGSGERQTLDIFQPGNTPPSAAPVLVFVHGGYWRMLDKSAFSYVANGFQESGAICVVLNYRLLPDAPFGGIVEDVQSAVQWVGDSIANHGGDPGRVCVCGHSAGAQLAGLAASCASGIRGFAGISGVYDLRPVQACFLNDIGFLDDELVERYGRDTIKPTSACQGFFAYGTDEGPEFERQTREQAELWQASGNESAVIPLSGLNHATTAECLNDPSHDLCLQINAMVSKGVS